MKRLPFLFALAAFAALPVHAAWTYDSYIDGNNFRITDGTWTIQLQKSSGTV